MSLDPRITELLLAWEDAAARGQPVSAEDLCRDCPDLMPTLEGRIKALQALSRVLDLDSFGTPITPWTSSTTRTEQPLGELPGHDLLEEIGRGGAGVVFKARHTNLKRLVAVKMLLGGKHAGELAITRFRGEAQTLAQLQHPHIIQIHEIGTHQGAPYFVLEYLDGGNLAELLGKQPLEPTEAAVLVELLARTVHRVHQAGVVHRDLKPANVLLQASEPGAVGAVQLRGHWYLPKLTDFGLARLTEDERQLTGSGNVVGTPAFMSPEQAQGKSAQIGPATDIYGLGVLLYQLLTASLPFQTEVTWKLIQQVITKDPEPPSRRAAGCSPEMDAICLQCLRKEPSERYATAEALADDLRRFVAGDAVKARRRRSQRWKWVAAGLALLGLFVWAALTFWLAGDDIGGTPPSPTRIAVGVLVSSDVQLAYDAEGILDGVNLAAAELKENGFEVVVTDAPPAADKDTVAAAKALIVESKVQVIVAALTPAELRVVLPVARQHKILLMIPVCVEGLEPTEGVVFLGPTAAQLALAINVWLRKSEDKSTALVVGNGTLFSRVAAEMTRRRLTRLPRPWEVVDYQVWGERGSLQVLAAERALLNPKPDMVVSFLPGDKNLELISELREKRLKAPVVCGRASRKLLESLETPVLAGNYVVQGFDSQEGDKASPFLRRYRGAFPSEPLPTDSMASAYAALHLWAKAVRQKDAADANDVEKLLGLVEFKGLGEPPLQIGKSSDFPHRGITISKVDNSGKLIPVWRSPAPLLSDPSPERFPGLVWSVFVDNHRERYPNPFE